MAAIIHCLHMPWLGEENIELKRGNMSGIRSHETLSNLLFDVGTNVYTFSIVEQISMGNAL